jgi:flagellar basal-body rod protein FlgC
MNLFGLLQISGTALLAQRQRAEMTASNLANADTTRTVEGGPYKRQNVIFAASHPLSSGFFATLASFTDIHTQTVQVAGVVEDQSAP